MSMNIGENIRKKRKELGIERQAEVAERAGLSKGYYNRIEQSARTPSVPVLAKIAKALHCTVDELINGKAV